MLRLVVERLEGPWDDEEDDQLELELDERDEDERLLEDEREDDDREDDERELDERELDDRDEGGMESPFPETRKHILLTILVYFSHSRRKSKELSDVKIYHPRKLCGILHNRFKSTILF